MPRASIFAGAVAGNIVGVTGRAGIGAGQLGHAPHGVDLVPGDQIVRIGDRNQVIGGVVAIARLGIGGGRVGAKVVPRGRNHPIFRIEGPVRPNTQGVGHVTAIAVGVVAIGRGVPFAIGQRRHFVAGVERAADRPGCDAAGVIGHLGGAIAHRVQRVTDAVASGIANVGKPVRRVVHEYLHHAIRRGHRCDITNTIVGHGGRSVGSARHHGACLQPSTGMVRHVSFDAVGIPHPRQAIIAIVGQVTDRLAQRIGLRRLPVGDVVRKRGDAAVRILPLRDAARSLEPDNRANQINSKKSINNAFIYSVYILVLEGVCHLRYLGDINQL